MRYGQHPRSIRGICQCRRAKEHPRLVMKFSKGDYLAGEEGKAIETGTTVTANLDELLAGWIKWKEGKPVEQRGARC